MSEFWDFFNEKKPLLNNRASTLQRTFEYLEGFKRPVEIIETGCVRKEKEDWAGDGRSTILFDRFIRCYGGHLTTIDKNSGATEYAKTQVDTSRCGIYCGDSVKILNQLVPGWQVDGRTPDLVYLDSLDYIEKDPFWTALHCANEFFAVRPILREDTLIVCDDTPSTFVRGIIPHIEFSGKGVLLALQAKQAGAKLMFSDWQVGWTRMVGETYPDDLKDIEIDRLIGRAREYVDESNAQAAEAVYRTVLARTTPPKSPIERVARGEACAFYARVAAKVGAYGTAGDWYRDAIIADPRAVDYRLEMIVKSLRPLNNWQLAEQEAMRCVQIEPDNALAWRILGDVEMSLCDTKKAIKAYDKQMELSPDDPDAMLDRYVIALDTADYPLAKKLAEQVLTTKRHADGLHVKAMIANREGRHEDAIPLFDEAIAEGCNNVYTAHWNKSLSLHAIGRYREGWEEHEQRRYQTDNPALSVAFQRFNAPCWEGTEPPPASIHVHAESGLGDNICFSRYLKLLADKGYEVRYEVHAEMVDLMQRSFPNIKVLKRAPDYPGAVGLTPFDYHLPVGSLAHRLGTDIDTVPWFGPYIKSNPYLAVDYGLKLRGYQSVPLNTRTKKIGVCWSAGIRDYGVWLAEYGKRKSIHYNDIKPIVHEIIMQGGEAINLQVGPERAQKDNQIRDLLPEEPTWDDTAALIENLDLVITVDTSVAHLAGAMGKPCWVLAQRDCASWHFLCWRPGASWNEASPWYPSIKLFRQHEFNKPHYWAEVVTDVTKALRDRQLKVA